MEKRPKYSGGIETRTETDSTNFEIERYRIASEKLKKMGSLIPTKGRRFFHGRAAEGDKFAVDPFFNNSGNNTGNHNINVGETVLHVAGQKTAEEFAEARARSYGVAAEIIEIEIPDSEASFFDCDQPWSERVGQTEKFRESFKMSFSEPVTGTILSMDDYHSLDYQELIDLVKHVSNYTPVISKERIPVFAKRLNISEEGAQKIIGSINVRNMVISAHDPHGMMSDIILGMINQKDDVTIPVWTETPDENGNVNRERLVCPINREYVHQWMRDMHIVGAKISINSATLNKPVEDAYEVFSLEEVKSKEQAEAARASRQRLFGNAALRIHKMLKHETGRKETPLKYIKMDTRVLPEDLVVSAKNVSPKYRALFEGSAGVKEGFSVEQHTESALRVYDASYKSNLPRSIYDFGRLCLLIHDIGKSPARKEGVPQKDYNAKYSKEFLKEIGAPKSFIEAIPLIIAEGMPAAEGTILPDKSKEEKEEARAKLWDVCSHIAETLFGVSKGSEDFDSYTKTLYVLCRTLTGCDGAAYTTRASTKGTKLGIRHYNTNTTFDKTFDISSSNPDYMRVKK